MADDRRQQLLFKVIDGLHAEIARGIEDNESDLELAERLGDALLPLLDRVAADAAAEASRLAAALEYIGRWVDTAKPGESRDSLEWRRVTKVCSEAGEAQDALDIATGGNPRKAGTKTYADVEKELLDAAGAALGAVEFLRDYDGRALGLLVDHMTSVAARAAELRAPARTDEEN